MKFRVSLILFFLLAGQALYAQQIVYSEPDRDDLRNMNFEIIGKMNDQFLVYKNSRSRHWIAVLDGGMKQLQRVEQDYLPDNDRVLNIDFFPYSDFVYMVYQYRKKNVIYCVAAKVGGDGKKIGDLVELDTTHLRFGNDSRIYTALASEDKSKIMVFKINSRNKSLYRISTLLFDQHLALQKKSSDMQMNMDERDDYLSQFKLDNDGDLIFTKVRRLNNENSADASFIIKRASADSFSIHKLENMGIYYDELIVKPDNYNKRYFLTSFYYSNRRGNIDGYYFYVWDKQKQQVVIEDTLTFNENLRREARGNAAVRTAFNDYFIRDVVTRRDGGFLIASESYYSTTRGGGWNRWNYLYGSPFYRNYDYYYWNSPYYYNSFWGNRWNDGRNMRYQADNITVVSFDPNGKKEWAGVITKEQFQDQSDDLISYFMMNTGGKLHFLFNNLEKRLQLLSDFALSPDGSIARVPTLKNLDRGYDFMPKYAKQVSARQVIIPCQYRNYICFAKIEF